MEYDHKCTQSNDLTDRCTMAEMQAVIRSI